MTENATARARCSRTERRLVLTVLAGLLSLAAQTDNPLFLVLHLRTGAQLYFPTQTYLPAFDRVVSTGDGRPYIRQ